MDTSLLPGRTYADGLGREAEAREVLEGPQEETFDRRSSTQPRAPDPVRDLQQCFLEALPEAILTLRCRVQGVACHVHSLFDCV